MHDIEPFYNWRHLYVSEEDEHSPFYKQEHSEFEFSQTVYNYYIHPQWDAFGSENIYMKIIYVDYDSHYCIIELLGEWNDAVANDIMTLKRNIIDLMIAKKIYEYIFIAENVLSFYADDESYYEEWYDDLEGQGWIAILNLPHHSLTEFLDSRIVNYLYFGNIEQWRTMKPDYILEQLDEEIIGRRIE